MTSFAVFFHTPIILKSSPEGEGFNPPCLQTLIHSHELQKHLATKQNSSLPVDSPLGIKMLIDAAYIDADSFYSQNLFKDLQQDYAVKFSEFKAIMAQNGRVLYMDEVASYKFSIGGRSFVLFHDYYSNPREEPLTRLCPYSSILFSHNVKNPYVYKTTFTSACWIFEELSDEVQVSHGKEHEKCLKKYNFLRSCPFVIVDEKEWVPPRY